MMQVSDIANLIAIRTYLVNSVDNMSIKLSRDEIKAIQARVSHIDKAIIENALKLELENVGMSLAVKSFIEAANVKSYVATSSVDDIKTTEDLDKLVLDPNVAISSTTGLNNAEQVSAPSEKKSSVKGKAVRRSDEG